MRRDFMDGATKTTETEHTQIVGQTQLHKLKSQIQNAFQNQL